MPGRLVGSRSAIATRISASSRCTFPGVHNVLNATAAIAVGVGLDVSVDAIRTALDQFRGVDRRFQLRGRAAGVSVIDDYGHHPTEIKATLAAARQCGFGKIHVIFQPHRYTRTRDLMDEFTTAFADADSLFVLDIYAASEKPIEGITAEILAQRIAEKSGKPVQHVSSFADAVSAAASRRARRRHDPDPGRRQRLAAGADDPGKAEGPGNRTDRGGGLNLSAVRSRLKSLRSKSNRKQSKFELYRLVLSVITELGDSRWGLDYLG